MKAYPRLGRIALFLILTYLIVYATVSLRAGKSFLDRNSEEQFKTKLESIKENLNKLGECTTSKYLKAPYCDTFIVDPSLY